MSSALRTFTQIRIGREERPLIIADAFATQPDLLRMAAVKASFGAAGQHYPGIRAELPPDYMRAHLPLVAQALSRGFGRFRRIHVLDASFSIVTTPPAMLEPRQRLPHVDAYGPERIALVHYLSPHSTDGTAFFRHRSTGYETIDEHRAPSYFASLKDELTGEALPSGYIAGDTPLFDRIERIDASYNRALLYHSYALHSGAIAADATLSPDPRQGRLTITAFFALE